MPSIFAAVKDYGPVDAPDDVGAKGDNGITEMKDGNYQHLSHNKTKRHQGTQTQQFTSLTVHVDICEYSFRKYLDYQLLHYRCLKDFGISTCKTKYFQLTFNF